MKYILFILLLIWVSIPSVVQPAVRYDRPALVLGSREQIAKAVEERYGAHFANIIRCESNFRHFDSKGNVLKSHTNDGGIMQINYPVWYEKAKSMGYNLDNPLDNFNFAQVIIDKQGIKAWTCSRKV